jgi:hypothetical protein
LRAGKKGNEYQFPRLTFTFMSRTRTYVLLLFPLFLFGCRAEPDYRVITADFSASKHSTVSKIELVPIDVGTSLLKLNKKITRTDGKMNSAIVGEITFSEHPGLPKAMGHSGAISACKMVIYFQDGTAYCFYVLFREGLAGSGVEYAINHDLNLDSAYDNSLPGNHTLGRGYSIRLYDVLQNVIQDAGGKWINDLR